MGEGLNVFIDEREPVLLSINSFLITLPNLLVFSVFILCILLLQLELREIFLMRRSGPQSLFYM